MSCSVDSHASYASWCNRCVNADPGSHVPHVTFHIPHAKLIESHVAAANARDVLDICTYTLSLHCGAHPGDGRRRLWPDARLLWQQFVLCLPAVAQEHQVSAGKKDCRNLQILTSLSLLLPPAARCHRLCTQFTFTFRCPSLSVAPWPCSCSSRPSMIDPANRCICCGTCPKMYTPMRCPALPANWPRTQWH